MIELDQFDIKILRLLQGNARATTVEIAEAIGLSATPSARRVKRLEDEGVIEGYVTLLNADMLGPVSASSSMFVCAARHPSPSTPSRSRSGRCRKSWSAIC